MMHQVKKKKKTGRGKAGLGKEVSLVVCHEQRGGGGKGSLMWSSSEVRSFTIG